MRALPFISASALAAIGLMALDTGCKRKPPEANPTGGLVKSPSVEEHEREAAHAVRHRTRARHQRAARLREQRLRCGRWQEPGSAVCPGRDYLRPDKTKVVPVVAVKVPGNRLILEVDVRCLGAGGVLDCEAARGVARLPDAHGRETACERAGGHPEPLIAEADGPELSWCEFSDGTGMTMLSIEALDQTYGSLQRLMPAPEKEASRMCMASGGTVEAWPSAVGRGDLARSCDEDGHTLPENHFKSGWAVARWRCACGVGECFSGKECVRMRLP